VKSSPTPSFLRVNSLNLKSVFIGEVTPPFTGLCVQVNVVGQGYNVFLTAAR
jgi:hypothetical protein